MMSESIANTTGGQAGQVPVSIVRDQEDRIVITWSDGATTVHSATQLRKACPCATCREKKRGVADKNDRDKPVGLLPVLSAAEAQPLSVDGMRPVGSYAYQITFSDGHSSGIYPFALLRD